MSIKVKNEWNCGEVAFINVASSKEKMYLSRTAIRRRTQVLLPHRYALDWISAGNENTPPPPPSDEAFEKANNV